MIFRDNYNKILSREEKDRLSRLLEKEIFQHPLTLKLLGKAGTYYFGNWDYLEEELQNNWNDVAEAVSYTHLDVYKRQQRRNPGWNLFRCCIKRCNRVCEET